MNKSRQLLLATTVAATALAGCSREEASAPAPEATQSVPAAESAVDAAAVADRFRNFLDENYAVDMARYPSTASYRGIKTNHDKWDPASEAFRDETREINEARLAQLADFDRDVLDDASALSWDLYRLNLERQLAADEFRHHRYVIHQHYGPHTSLPSFLINVHRVNNLADAEAYIGRLHNTGKLFDEVIEQLRIRQEKNFLLADWQYPKVIEASRNVITGAPFDDSGEDSAIWADFQGKVDALAVDAAGKRRLLREARTALRDVVQPAYRRLIAELQAQAANAPDADGVWKFDGGDAFYAERLRWYTTTDLTADEVHEIGLREVARIHAEMEAIKETVGFEGTLADFFVFMREDEQFYYPNTDAGRAAYLAEAMRLIDVMRERLPEMFGLLPEAELVVKRVEPFREKSAGKAFYQDPPTDGSRPGIYYANLYDMKDMPKYQMEALAYHEGLPGHHMQSAITVELKDIPEFQRYSHFTAFSEGWGLYTEQVPKEMGFYQDPYSDFGRLAMELWRACRLVVDTGIHHKRWTREEAIDYLVENTPNATTDATTAIERYIAMPGQATAYMIGKLKILELREKARNAMGDAFDIRDFHDLVLRDGPVPLSILERKVDAMISAAQAG